MSVHKLTAGSGYDYLTRQVAALDATEKGHVGLASYYTERGEAPGQWIGSGLAGIDGLAAGDPVTQQQMHALFGFGHHPLAADRLAALEAKHDADARGPGARDRQTATRLGAPFKVYAADVSSFRMEVARRVAAIGDSGLTAGQPVSADERARVRTEVAREIFAEEHGRSPRDARELAGTIARLSRPRATAVAGYDLAFSPVKSVSALWAVAPPDVAAQIERAHQGAVADALRFIETHALYTRTGTNGVRQVDVTGLVATAFTHRDSRAGDPDLHTHVAVANKVQTRGTGSGGTNPGGTSSGGTDGRWLSIDGRVLLKAVVAASETYNTALEARLRDDLGLQFEPRAVTSRSEAGKRPVREVVGIDTVLLQRWATRRGDIDARRGELAAQFQRDHGRPPTPVETLHLAQQANLETRAAKHEPRTLAEQRTVWRVEADEVLGQGGGLHRMLGKVLAPAFCRTHANPAGDAAWLDSAAERALAALQQNRSTWQVWHVRAEAQRQVRAAGASVPASEQAVEALVAEVLHRRSVALSTAERRVDGRLLGEPGRLRRADGSSVYRVAGSDLYTSAAVLAAERRLVELAGQRDGHAVDARAVDVALLEATANGTTLNAGQAALVREMATSGARVQLAIAPAGAGKTTAMSVLAAAWAEGGGNVVGLAPSAAAAAALRESTGTRTDTLAKLTWSLTHETAHDSHARGVAQGEATMASAPDWVRGIDAGTLVVIDEAGMADTISLHAAVEFVAGRGGSVRLVGDDQQLAAIGAGGVLRDIQASHGALRLDELLRFADRAEAAASLALREGRPEALGFYLDNDRVHVGDLTTMTAQVLQAWQHDRAAGLDSIMLAPTRELVSDLNQRTRAHRLATQQGNGPTVVRLAMVRLADGNEASEGDLLLTRTNDRSLRTTATDWVKNGDRWTLTATHDDGAVTARHLGSGRSVRLPADYVRTSTELGYATTVHSAQGLSVDTMHGLVGGGGRRRAGGNVVSAAAVHDAHSRPPRQPRLPARRRGRRPPRRRAPRGGAPSHRDRAPRGHPRPRRQPDLGGHPAARPGGPRRPARVRHRPLPRRPRPRRRRHHRPRSRVRRRGRGGRPGAGHQPDTRLAGAAGPPAAPDRQRGEPRRGAAGGRGERTPG
ncbi:MobF family relaxase [Aquipuribacter hungaricus]|uniref:MobF family relaxase n=1 Tax=Aquipuribacter hungaricus TaxID=545624 RepID=A0ABV7WBK3_9MICO